MNSLMDLEFIDESRYSLLDIRYSLMNLGFIDESWIHWWILDSLMDLDIHWWYLNYGTRNPKSYFFGKSKKTRAGKWSRSVFSKNNLEPSDAIWCQFGSQFSSPKTRVYEYNQLIFSILTVFFFFEIPGTWKPSQKSSFFDKMATFFMFFLLIFSSFCKPFDLYGVSVPFANPFFPIFTS